MTRGKWGLIAGAIALAGAGAAVGFAGTDHASRKPTRRASATSTVQDAVAPADKDPAAPAIQTPTTAPPATQPPATPAPLGSGPNIVGVAKAVGPAVVHVSVGRG